MLSNWKPWLWSRKTCHHETSSVVWRSMKGILGSWGGKSLPEKGDLLSNYSSATFISSLSSSFPGTTSTMRSSSPSCCDVILMVTELSAVSATASSSSPVAVSGTGEGRCIGEGGGSREMGGGACEEQPSRWLTARLDYLFPPHIQTKGHNMWWIKPRPQTTVQSQLSNTTSDGRCRATQR